MNIPSTTPLPKNGQCSLKVTQQFLAVAWFRKIPWENLSAPEIQHRKMRLLSNTAILSICVEVRSGKWKIDKTLSILSRYSGC